MRTTLTSTGRADALAAAFASVGAGFEIRYLDRADLNRMRRAVGRPKDLRRAAELTP